MSFGFSERATQAAQALRASPEWQAFRDELLAIANEHVIRSIEVPPEQRVEATTYARALRDIHIAVTAATTGVRLNQVERPRPVKR